jgi:hypothetical protein
VKPTDGVPEPDEYAYLRDPVLTEVSRRADAEIVRARLDARMRARRRGRKLVVAGLVLVVAAALVGIAVTRLPNRADRSAAVTIHTAPPVTVRLISESPVPPAKGAPFPSVASGADVLRHSGGPYISGARVGAKVLAQLECTLGKPRRDMPGFTCARVDVAFFAEYGDAWKLRGASWAFVHRWGADREMYVVTVWGHLESEVPRAGAEPALTEITTVEIDATTGRTMMEGGPPLPAADANR